LLLTFPVISGLQYALSIPPGAGRFGAVAVGILMGQYPFQDIRDFEYRAVLQFFGSGAKLIIGIRP